MGLAITAGPFDVFLYIKIWLFLKNVVPLQPSKCQP